MGNYRSPESQHNVGDTIIYDAQRQTVLNLGNFKWDHFHRFQMKINHCPIFPHSHNGKDGPVFNKGPFDPKGGQWPHGTL